MTEIHIYTEHGDKFEQAYVFLIEREHNGKVNMKNMYTVTVVPNGGEVKTKLNMNNIIKDIIENVGGNIDTSKIDSVFSVFGDLIPEEVKQELIQQNDESNLLLRSSDLAMIAHPINQTIDEIIQSKKNENNNN